MRSHFHHSNVLVTPHFCGFGRFNTNHWQSSAQHDQVLVLYPAASLNLARDKGVSGDDAVYSDARSKVRVQYCVPIPHLVHEVFGRYSHRGH